LGKVAAVVGIDIAKSAPDMGPEFAKWLLAKTEKEGWEEKSVYEHLMKLNRDGKIALAHFTDSVVWNKVAEVVGAEKMAEAASFMGAEFAEWLVAKTEKEGWEEKSVYEHLLKLNRDGKIALAHFTDSSVWNKVAEVVGAEEMAQAAFYMGAEFADWLLVKIDQENYDKEKAGWEKEKVYKRLCQANKEHKTALSRPMPMSLRTKLSTWAPEKGLHFRVDNKELAEALKSWQTSLADVGEEKEEEGELVRSLIEKKGVVVNLLGNADHLQSAVNQWNERNKHLSVLINKEESEENEKWTDRALMQEYGPIDSIEVEEQQHGIFIHRIRARCFRSPSPISPILPPGMAQISTTNGLPGDKLEISISTRESPVS